MIKYMICLIKAIPFWMYFGVYSPHTYSDIIEHKKNIYMNENGKIRLADGFMKDTMLFKKTEKPGMKDIQDIANLARKYGMSYGEFVAKYDRR